jgi:hypothetical protein
LTFEERLSVDVQYAQLNERSRMYTTQLWQIPGLYLALSAWTIERFKLLDIMPNGAASLAMAFITFVVWVFVSQLKYLERRAVDQMRLLEGKPVSTGGTRFFFSYLWYVRALLVLASFWYLCTAVRHLSAVAPWRSELTIWGPILLFVFFVALFVYDRHRSRTTIAGIRAEYEEPSRLVRDV